MSEQPDDEKEEIIFEGNEEVGTIENPCNLKKLVKKGLYYTATVRCPNGSTATASSSNKNVAIQSACMNCSPF